MVEGGGAFSTLNFNLTPQVQALLASNRRDFSIKFAVNSSSPGAVLDRVGIKP